MRPRRLLGEVEHADDLVVRISSSDLLHGDFLNSIVKYMRPYSQTRPKNTRLGKQFGLRQVPEHLRHIKLVLMLPVLGHLKHPNLAAPALGQLHLLVLRELIAQLVYARRLGQQERNRSLVNQNNHQHLRRKGNMGLD